MTVSLEDIQDKLIPISAASGPTHVIAPLAPSQDTTPDQIAYFQRPNSIPFVRHSPLPAAANAQINAVAKTIAQQVVAETPPQAATGSIELDIPSIFTPTTQSVDLPGPLSFGVALETEGTVWAAGIPFAGGFADKAEEFAGGSADPIDVSVTSGGNNEVAIFLQASDGGSHVFTSPWTNWQNTSTASVNAQFLPTIGTTVGFSGSSGGADYAGTLVLLGATALPTVVQSKQGSTNLTGAGTSSTGNFGSANTAGNSILFFVSVHNVSGTFDSTGASAFDTHGNSYDLLDTVVNTLTTTCIVYLCPSIGASASNAVTVNFPAGGNAVVTVSAFELSPVLHTVQLFPQFIQIAANFLKNVPQTISGSRSGGTALTNLLNGLATSGLIVNSTTP